MKHLFLTGSIAVAALLTACSSDDVIDRSKQNADTIHFDVTAGRMTRAADVYCNTNLPTSFNVWATYLGEGTGSRSTYIDGDEITDVDGVWTNQKGDRYWPNSGELRFFGYVNAKDAFEYNDGKPTFTDYEVDTIAANQLDLLYAIQTSAKTNDPVKMNFRHALAQVVFQAKNTNQNLHVTIYGVTVVNVSKSGTYTFDASAQNTEENINDHTGNGTYDANGRGTWALGSTLGTYPVSFTGVPLSTVNEVMNLTNTNETDKQWGNALVLLPQPTATTAWDLTTGNKASQTYLLVNYSAYNEAAGDKTYIWGSETAGKNAAVPASFNWEEGKKYIYTLVFGQGNGGVDPDNPDKPVLVPISFDITVDDFVNAEQDIDATTK